MAVGDTTVPELLGTTTVGAYAEAMGEAVALLADQVRRVRRPRSSATVEQLRARFDEVDLDRPLGDTRAALAEVVELYVDHAVWFHDPAYLAHLNCPVAIPALAADALASAINTSVDTWDQSTAGTLVEQRLVEWTARRIGFPPGADGVFTSGGTMSNLQAALLAREECRARDRPDGAARLRVLTSSEGHFSVRKAARLLGLGPDAVMEVATDARRRLDPRALARALRAARGAGDVPMAVVATAGTTDLGRIDPLMEVADVCAAHGVWLHVDAAYGCGLLVSRRRRHLLDGIERADSVTVDYHKSFFQPVSASALIVRDGGTLRHATLHADYLNPRGSDLPNQVDKSLQTTRRLDALKLWTTLRALGADRIGDLFDAVVDLAADVHAWLRDQDDVEVAAGPTLSTVLFRYRPAPLTSAQAGMLAPRIRSLLFDAGDAVVAGTRLDGSAWLKLTLLNPAVTVDDVRRVVELVREVGAGLLAADLAPERGRSRGRDDLVEVHP